jgi:hypothetical protein
MVIIKKLPVEFQVVVLKDIYAIKPELKSHEVIQDWINKNANKLFG